MKKIGIFILLLATTALVTSARAAIGEQVWVQRYNGPANGGENAFAIAVDGSGNVFVAGLSAGSAGNSELVTLKYSSAGVLLWTNLYNGPGNGSDEANAIAVDHNGDVIVTGESVGSNATLDYVTIKYSGNGAALWTNRFEPGNSVATAVGVDTNGGVFVTGYSFTSGWATIKYSSTGAPLWTNFYNSGLGSLATAIAVHGSGNVFVTGRSGDIGTGDDFATVAYSSAGVSLWTNLYNGPDNDDDIANDIALDTNGNVFVTGGVSAGGLTEFATIKYSNAGVPVWTNRYRGTGNSTYGGAGDIAVDASGNVFVTGTSVGSGTYNDIATIKYSNSGVPLWTNRYHRLYGEVANAIAVDKVGNVFVTGYMDDDNLRFDRLTIAYSNAGVPLWTNRYNGPGNDDDSGNAIAVDASGNVVVTGYSFGTNNHDLATIKYAGVQPIPLSIQQMNNAQVMSWDNATFRLQSAPAITDTFTNITAATSPYTNIITGSQRYFRLRLN